MREVSVFPWSFADGVEDEGLEDGAGIVLPESGPGVSR
jgi:hypothetical protein